MRLYSGTSAELVQDSIGNRIAGRLEDAFFNAYHFDSSPNEVRSWQNSLRAISQVSQEADLLQNGVVLEYQLPLTSKHIHRTYRSLHLWIVWNSVLEVEVKPFWTRPGEALENMQLWQFPPEHPEDIRD